MAGKPVKGRMKGKGFEYGGQIDFQLTGDGALKLNDCQYKGKFTQGKLTKGSFCSPAKSPVLTFDGSIDKLDTFEGAGRMTVNKGGEPR